MDDKTAQQGLGGANNDELSDGNQQCGAANVKAFPHSLLLCPSRCSHAKAV